MDELLKEISFTIRPYTLTIIGDGPRTFFFRVQSTQTDYSEISGILGEITRHILALKKLREAVEETD